jgi:hypothetical protein
LITHMGRCQGRELEHNEDFATESAIVACTYTRLTKEQVISMLNGEVGAYKIEEKTGPRSDLKVARLGAAERGPRPVAYECQGTVRDRGAGRGMVELRESGHP